MFFILGECIQAEDDLDRKNTNTPRTLDFMNLRPSKNRQLGYNLLYLQTKKNVNRKKI